MLNCFLISDIIELSKNCKFWNIIVCYIVNISVIFVVKVKVNVDLYNTLS